MKLRAGDWVEVRSKEEILNTLDKKGRLEGLVFMPGMFQYCGQRFQVYKRAHKTCDWVYKTWGRRLPNAIHLDLRCDGEAYDGCQNLCLLFWKDAWVKPVDGSGTASEKPSAGASAPSAQPQAKAGCTEEGVWAATRAENRHTPDEPRYSCQGTTVIEFTTLLPWWDLSQYLEDYTSGNVSLGRLLRGFVYASYFNLINTGIGLGRPLRWFYDVFQGLWGGLPYPRRSGTIPEGQPTPKGIPLNLQPGELAKVKSYKDILATLNTSNRNRGLYFDGECVPFCGGTHPVKTRVNKAIDEETGKMVVMKDPSIILDGVYCQGRYSHCRMFCPRSHYPWWREIWLERARASSDGAAK
jgi:hypothetical protein